MEAIASAIGFLSGAAAVVFVLWAQAESGKKDCALEHNVFACERVITYVPATAGKE